MSFEYFTTVAQPGGNFQFHQNDLPCQLYNFGPENSDFVSSNSHKTNNFKDLPPYQVKV